MVRILRLVLFSIALSVTVSGTVLIAQTPESFYIGTFGFSPEWDGSVHRIHYIEGVLSNPVGNQRLHFLGDTIFARARELGLNLIGTVVHPDSVETLIESNAVHEICDAAAPGGPLPDLGVAVLDFGILEKLAGERIMLHPESELDFS